MQLYKISFTTTEKVYIGISTRSAHLRFIDHKRQSSKSTISMAIRKHGNPILTILGNFEDFNELCFAEQKAIVTHNSKAPFGYNLSIGGESSTLGVKKTPNQCRHISDRNKEYYNVNPEARIQAAQKTKAQFSKPEARKLVSERTTAFFSSEDARQYNRDRMKDFNKNNPEKAKARSDKSNTTRRTAVARKYNSERRKEFCRNNPEHTQTMINRLREHNMTQAAKDKQSRAMIAHFSNKDNRALVSAGLKKYYADKRSKTTDLFIPEILDMIKYGFSQRRVASLLDIPKSTLHTIITREKNGGFI